MLNYDHKSVEEVWVSFKSAINQDIVKFITIKRLRAKRSLPWITREIEGLIRKRDRLFHVQKSFGRNRDRHHFKQVKHHIQTEIKSANHNYLQDILAAQSADKSPSDFLPKKLYSLIKNARQDHRASQHF